ncbi:hypothetical protein CBL_06153 [Carabus blaptoides fortunei]
MRIYTDDVGVLETPEVAAFCLGSVSAWQLLSFGGPFLVPPHRTAAASARSRLAPCPHTASLLRDISHLTANNNGGHDLISVVRRAYVFCFLMFGLIGLSGDSAEAFVG